MIHAKVMMMKISKSKRQLAKVISENGGWRKGSYAAQDSVIRFFVGDKPKYNKKTKLWDAVGPGARIMAIGGTVMLPNRQRTTLSSSEYFSIYPAPDADGWIEWKGGDCPVGDGVLVDVRLRSGSRYEAELLDDASWSDTWGNESIIAYRLHKPQKSEPQYCESVTRSIPEPIAAPTIEQLAADYRNKLDYANRKQDEADKANMESDAALAQLEDAIAEIGFAVTPLAATEKEPELVITDWLDLQVGDIVEIVGSENERWLRFKGVELFVSRTGSGECGLVFRSHDGDEWGHGGNTNWRFIRRP